MPAPKMITSSSNMIAMFPADLCFFPVPPSSLCCVAGASSVAGVTGPSVIFLPSSTCIGPGADHPVLFSHILVLGYPHRVLLQTPSFFDHG